MRIAMVIISLALAGCHSTARWAACAHGVAIQCSSLTPIAAVP